MYRHLDTQLSIEIANAPSEIARVSDLLSDNGITVNAMSTVDEADRGYFRFLSDDSNEAERILKLNGFEVKRERVISVKLNDQKGQLARITNALAQAHINIDYFYAAVDHGGSAMHLVMKVENVPLATRVLDEIIENRIESSTLSLA